MTNISEAKKNSHQQKTIRQIDFTARLVLLRRAATCQMILIKSHKLKLDFRIFIHPRVEVGQVAPHHPPAHPSSAELDFHSTILISENL